MCGILGCFILNDKSFKKEMEYALQLLKHRGPDYSELESYTLPMGRLHLGHTRLSIIDLSQNGYQPMHSQDKRYTLIFNGEIYNYVELADELKKMGHQFSSKSDTEVLLNAWCEWQENCLTKLSGNVHVCSS